MSDKLIKCKTCNADIAQSAKACPVCGAKNKKKHPVLAGILIFLGLIITISNIININSNDAVAENNDNDAPAVVNTPPATESNQLTKPVQTEDSVNSSGAEQNITPSHESALDMTMGQTNALRAAKNYLQIMAFSYDGIIKQLEFEGYSTEDATFAANNCEANWDEQALKSAKNYLQFSAFSYSGLITQLEFEGFTADQATYGVDKCGADWYEQAVLAAKNYLSLMAFSRDGLIEQLKFEGFTSEQATYAVEQNGY